MSDLQTFKKLVEKRRSVYGLGNNLPISNDEIVKLVEHAVLHVPSSFNSQSTRVLSYSAMIIKNCGISLKISYGLSSMMMSSLRQPNRSLMALERALVQ